MIALIDQSAPFETIIVFFFHFHDWLLHRQTAIVGKSDLSPGIRIFQNIFTNFLRKLISKFLFLRISFISKFQKNYEFHWSANFQFFMEAKVPFSAKNRWNFCFFCCPKNFSMLTIFSEFWSEVKGTMFLGSDFYPTMQTALNV